MGLGHAGLNDIIREQKKKNPLFAKVIKDDGGLVLFINTRRTAAKLYQENGEVIGYLRMPDGSRITERSIDFIPKTFGGSVEYASAVKAAFKKFLEVEKDARPRYAEKAALMA